MLDRFELNFDLKSAYSAETFASNKFDADLDQSCLLVRQLQSELQKCKDENARFARQAQEQANSVRVLTLENDVYLKSQGFYMDQLKKQEERGEAARREFERRAELKAAEYRKEINSLKETLNARQSLLTDSFARQQSELPGSRDSLRGGSEPQGPGSLAEQALRKKIALLEVGLLEVAVQGLQGE